MEVSKALLLLGAVLAGLSRPGQSLTVMEQVVAANNDYAMDLYDQVRSNSVGKNIFFSPFSVSSALAMVYAGARGNTKTQMETSLKLSSVNGNVHGGFRQLFTAFNDHTNKYKLSVANALFGRKEYPFQQAYINLVGHNYFSLVKSLDFVSKPEPSRLYINQWVASHTNQKIKNLFAKGTISPLTALVLVNAIYFKGLWKLPFEKKSTKTDTFFLSASNTRKTRMMNVEEQFNYAEVSNLNCKILELPYTGDEISMYILLPNTNNGLTALESQLTFAGLNAAIASMYKHLVGVHIPKFKMTFQVNLKGILKSMGMTDMFNSNVADLSGIDGTRNLFVSDVVHKAYIDVNEEVTEAAGATGIGVGITSVQHPKTFNANHPFLFFIREKVTGSILFSGRVVTPPKAKGGAAGTGSGNNPPWCEGLSKWMCNLTKWLKCKPERRASP